MSAEHSTAEAWKDIPGMPGYQASSLGRFRSLPRVVEQRGRWGGFIRRDFPGMLLRQHFDTYGYPIVCVGSPSRNRTAHGLVALTFIGPRPPGLEVNHKDGDKTNNTPGNLEYVTSTENNRHALETGLRPMKVTDAQIQEMRVMAARVSLREVGRRFGVHHTYVRHLIDGKRKTKGS